jgi:hypothetical protein
MTTSFPDLTAPWSLNFDRNGTEDFGVICDAKGHDLAYTSEFWLPEPGHPVPRVLAAARLMTAGPDLFDALDLLLQETVDMDLKHGIGLSEGERLARKKALKAIKKARA